MKRRFLTSVLGSAALVLPLAYAIDPPEMKEGLWSVHTQTTNQPGNQKSEGAYTLCRSHAYDRAARERLKNMKGCTLNESFGAGKYSATSHCMVGATAVDTTSTTVVQGENATHSETHGTYTPPLAGMSEINMVMDQKYVGTCPAGAVPGDRTEANGRVTHLGR